MPGDEDAVRERYLRPREAGLIEKLDRRAAMPPNDLMKLEQVHRRMKLHQIPRAAAAMGGLCDDLVELHEVGAPGPNAKRQILQPRIALDSVIDDGLLRRGRSV